MVRGNFQNTKTDDSTRPAAAAAAWAATMISSENATSDGG